MARSFVAIGRASESGRDGRAAGDRADGLLLYRGPRPTSGLAALARWWSRGGRNGLTPEALKGELWRQNARFVDSSAL